MTIPVFRNSTFYHQNTRTTEQLLGSCYISIVPGIHVSIGLTSSSHFVPLLTVALCKENTMNATNGHVGEWPRIIYWFNG